MHNICPRSKICLKYAQDMPQIRDRYAHAHAHARVMPKICPRYAKDVLKIGTIYIQYMLNICPPLLSTFEGHVLHDVVHCLTLSLFHNLLISNEMQRFLFLKGQQLDLVVFASPFWKVRK